MPHNDLLCTDCCVQHSLSTVLLISIITIIC
jgi:hypothetical protein